MQRRTSSLVSIVTIALCTTTVALLLREMYERRAGTLPPQSLDAMRLVHHRILEDYVFEEDAEELVYSAIEGMVTSLDDYCRFVRPRDVREFEGNEITGTYDGIGVQMVGHRSPPTVLWPLPGGPAEAVGVRVGDEFVEIEGDPAQFSDAARLLRGPTDSSVSVTVRRANSELQTLTIERSAVRKPAVKWTRRLGRDQQIGYIYVGEFQRGMVDAFDSEIERLRDSASPPMQSLIVDIRGNTGGLLDEAIALTNRFLRSGTIVSLKKRNGEVVESHDAAPELCTLPELPVVVLIDRRSASAAEVFAAALQDHGRARLVGERTFGKGVVQRIYSWPGYPFRLKMTSSHYYTPNGRNLSKTLRRDEDGEDPGGVDPDVPIALTRQEVDTHARTLFAAEIPRRYRGEVEALAETLELKLSLGPDPTTDSCVAAAIEDLEAGR